MAVPTTGLIESAPGGLPLIGQAGLNTTKASNLAGFLVDSSGNVTVPGTLLVTGITTSTGASTDKMAVISGSGATVTLTAAQSGSFILMDRAAGIVFTLPAPAVGLYFDFLVTVSVTTNAYKVITDAGTTLLAGSLMSIDTDTANAVAAFTGNGSTHISVNMTAAGTNALGGIQGTWLRFICVTTTLWLVEGIVQGAGTVATPFSTS